MNIHSLKTRVAGACLALALTAFSPAATIDFLTFPDGTLIPDETVITTQFASLGVVFSSSYPDSPRSKTFLDGILISGGPTGFFDEIRMDFTVPVNLIDIGIVGSGLGISASISAFDASGASLGTSSKTYNGTTGLVSSLKFTSPDQSIAYIIYDGGLNPNAAASIASLSFSQAPPPQPPQPPAQSVPDSASSVMLVGLASLAVIALRPKGRKDVALSQ